MEEKDFKIVGKLLNGFGFKQLQLGRDVWQTATSAGISFEMLQGYISTVIERNVVEEEKVMKEALKVKKKIEKLFPPCPECGLPFIAIEIKIPKGPGNLYGHKIHWFCPHCMHEEFSKDEFEIVMERLKTKVLEEEKSADN